MLARCAICGFKVPWDSIGRLLMQTHLEIDHGIKVAQEARDGR